MDLLIRLTLARRWQLRTLSEGHAGRSRLRSILGILSVLILVVGMGVAFFWPFHSGPCTISNEPPCANPALGLRILIGVASALVAFVLYGVSRHGERTRFLASRDRDWMG